MSVPLPPFTAPPSLPLLLPSLPTLAFPQHGKAVWAHAVSVGRNWKKDGSACYRAGRALSFHRGPQGGHPGSQVCASERTVMKE